MRLNQLLSELIVLADENPLRMEAEVMTRKPNGEICQINKAIWQKDAEEIQLFIAES